MCNSAGALTYDWIKTGAGQAYETAVQDVARNGGPSVA